MSTRHTFEQLVRLTRRPARIRRARPVDRLGFETFERRCVLSGGSTAQAAMAGGGMLTAPPSAQSTGPAPFVQSATSGGSQSTAEATVLGTRVDGRIGTDGRAYGFSSSANTAVFDVGLGVANLSTGSKAKFHVMQGVTFWNGRGTPRFVASRQPVEFNFGKPSGDIRVGSRRNVGAMLDIGSATANPDEPTASQRYTVSAGVGGSGPTFARQAPAGVYAIVGRFVTEGTATDASAPMTLVFQVGTVPTGIHQTAVQFLGNAPPVSVSGIQTPSSGVYGTGKDLRVTYEFSDPVTVTGAPRLPLTLTTGTTRQGRMAVFDRNLSSPTRLVFRYQVQANDGFVPRLGTFQGTLQPTQGQLQLPRGSAIRSVTGGVVFSQTTAPVTFNDVRVGSLRVLRPDSTKVPDGDYRPGAELWFGLEMTDSVSSDLSGGTPTIPIMAIGGSVIGQAEYAPNDAPPFQSSSLPFRFIVPAGVVARQGVIVSGPISLNGGKILDQWGNAPVLTFNPLRVPRVRIVNA